MSAPPSDASSVRLTAERLSPWARLGLTFAGIHHELSGSRRLAADAGSFVRFASDALGYRAQRILRHGGGTRRRTVRFKDGTELTYRLNRGDVRAIAEVWMTEAYELPFDIRARHIIDLGANIGAASVWLIRRYGGSKLVAVEPVPENAELTRVNLARTGIDTEVIPAAVAPRHGSARFTLSHSSAWGRLGDDGPEVPLITPQSLIERFPPNQRIDLVKMDVEGAEQELFKADLRWLGLVDCLVVELHADRVDWRGIIDTLSRLGFSHRQIAERNIYCGPTDLMVAFRRT